MHLKNIFIKIRDSKKKRASQATIYQKRASQGFFDPIQKCALSRSLQLEAVYLEALQLPKKTQELPKNTRELPKNTQELPKNTQELPKNTEQYPTIPKIKKKK